MMHVAVTGAAGFIGRNVMEAIGQSDDVRGSTIVRETSDEARRAALDAADLVLHLAGANRPTEDREFTEVNVDFTAAVVDDLLAGDARPVLVFASSTKAEDDTPYGRSKRAAEAEIRRYAEGGGCGIVYRLPNVFGKWCRPDYNSAVATFCHRIARGQEIDVHDPSAPLDLVHVADVVASFLDVPTDAGPGCRVGRVEPLFSTTVGEVADTIRGFPAIRASLDVPDLSRPLIRRLYSTYLSYLPADDLRYALREHSDERGKLAELLRGDTFGQIFVSTTRPGVVRGNHSHRVKVEKFFVLSGEGVIRIRTSDDDDVTEFAASGTNWTVVDIPPGTVHNIENVGDDEMLVLFWAAEVFDPEAPDTYAGKV